MANDQKAISGTELGRKQWVFAFALVTSLFFTWGFAYGLLDVLNAHFQVVFDISKLQSTLLQVAYFGAYFIWAPWAGMIMDRVGYKKGIHFGLTLYSLGAIFFWPSAKFRSYGGFVGSTFVIGCGLSTLEVAANSYIAVLGSNKYAAARLNFAQGFQGIASFTGPLIASKEFFRGKNATSLDTVQWVYLAVAGLGLVLNVLFFFCHLPELTDTHGSGVIPQEPFYKQYRCLFGWVAQTAYVGAQVGVAALTVNFLIEQGLGISASTAANMFSGCQATFTVGRFVGVLILQWLDPALLLTVHALMCFIASMGIALASGWGGVAFLYILFFFESVCYPCIFTLATKNLGKYSKRGSGLIVTGVGGGAWYPSAQGALADKASTRRSYLVPMSGYIAMMIYAVGIVIDQARKGGFRVRTKEDYVVVDQVGVTAVDAEGGARVEDAAHTGSLEKMRESSEKGDTGETGVLVERVA